MADSALKVQMHTYETLSRTRSIQRTGRQGAVRITRRNHAARGVISEDTTRLTREEAWSEAKGQA